MPFEIRYCAETGSTNDDAVAILGEPGSAGVVLQADYQRAGKGRRAHGWIAPRGTSLLCTALLPQPVPSDALWAVPFWTALGVAAGIERATGVRVGLQWPNDLLLDERKCCGILCVSRVAGARAWVGCGTGLNVQRPEDGESYAGVVPPPAFLSDVAPGVRREPVLAAILDAYDATLHELKRPQAVARAWERRAALEGTTYRLVVDGDGRPFVAVARKIGDDGSLIVANGAGERRISLAEARVLREKTT